MLNSRSLSLVLALCLSAPVVAAPPAAPKKAATPTVDEIAKQRAREAYQRATKYYNIGDFKEALASFKEAYLAYEDPTFLFNIAQCHRSLSQKVEAIRAYRAYLRAAPQTGSRSEVEQLIANLERALAEEQSASRRTPTGTIAPGETPGNGEAPVATVESERRPTPTTTTPTPKPTTTEPTHTTTTTPTTTTAVVTATAPPPEGKPTPIYKKWWLWTIVGVVVVGAGVGVGVGLALGGGTKYPGAQTSAGTFRF